MTILGRLSKPGERDEFTIKAPPGSKHEVRVEAWGLGSALDGQLRVLGKDGRLLGEIRRRQGASPPSRGGGGGPRARARCRRTRHSISTMPAGQDEVRIVVKDLMDRGGVGFTYRLIVQPAEAAFQLTLDDDQVAIPRGGTALIPVTITRGGYAGPIDLDIRGLAGGQRRDRDPRHRARRSDPRAWSASKPTPASRFDARDDPGRGQGIERPGRRGVADDRLRPADDLDARLRHDRDDPRLLRGRFVSLTAAVTRPGPIVLNPGAAKLVVPPGRHGRGPGPRSCGTAAATAKYQLVAPSPPTGLSVAASEMGESTASAAVKVTAAADAPLGPLTLGLVAHAPAGLQGRRSRRRRAS